MEHDKTLGNKHFKDIYRPKPEHKVTVGKTAEMRDDWYDTHVETLAQDPNPMSQRLAIQLCNEKAARQPAPQDRDKNIIEDDDLEAVFPKQLPRDLVARTAGARGKDLDKTAVKMRDSYIRHMNHKPWLPIEKDITEPSGTELTSKMTPVNAAFHETYGALGQTGLGSMSGRLRPEKRTAEEKQRPTNLWKTSLEKDDKTLFEGFRSGAFVDTARDEKQRKANADARAKGVLEAALIDKLGKMSGPERQKYLSGEKRYDGTMVSIDLLSGTGADKGLAAEHHESLKHMNKMVQSYPITWDGQQHDVSAMFNVIDFMTGVNGGNNPLVGPVPNPTKTNSDDQAAGNQKSWSRLMEQVTQVRKYPGSATLENRDRKAKIEALTGGIEDAGLGASGSYQLPAMIANLAYQLGDSVHFNCKSGKDRTGIMDSESKFMARQLDKQSGTPRMDVPNVAERARRSPEQNYEHDQMLWEGGNLDILAQNVGGQCLKTADFASAFGFKHIANTDHVLADNLGGVAMMTELGGLKRYADIDTITTFDEKNLLQRPAAMSKKDKLKYAKRAEDHNNHLPPLPAHDAPVQQHHDVVPTAVPVQQQQAQKRKPLPPIPPHRVVPQQPVIQLQPQLAGQYVQNMVQHMNTNRPQQPAQRPHGVTGDAFKYFG